MINIFALWESGLIGLLMKEGNINKLSTVDVYCKIYRQFKYLRETGHNYIEAVELAAEKENVSKSVAEKAVLWTQNRI